MKLYIAKSSELARLDGVNLLSADRRAKLEKLNIFEDKQRCLAAGLLLRHVFGPRVGDMVYEEGGKPYLADGPFFNISHSGEYVVLAVSEKPVGVDIEKLGQYKEKLARRCCTDEELLWLEAQDKSEFYRLWTGKESIMKAVGKGLAMAPGSFSVLPAENGPHFVEGSCWYLRWQRLPGYYICCACAADENIELIYTEREILLGQKPAYAERN